MKIGILGSRSINDWKLINKLLHEAVSTNPFLETADVVLGSSAKGVDRLVKDWCTENQVAFVEFLPYHMLDKSVEFDTKFFFIRNKQLIDNSDKVIAIWDTESKDTEYGIKYAQKKNIPVTVVKVPKSS